MDKAPKFYNVEYECAMYGVVYYREVQADSFEEAKWQISGAQPDAIIRAVSLLTTQDDYEYI